MDILLDNIIFLLQKSGGISVVWFELLHRLLKDKEFNLKFIDFQTDNIFRANLNIPELFLLPDSLNAYPNKIHRYLNPKIKEKGIFHSSYYRIVKNPNIRNITTVHDFTYEYYRKGLPNIIHQIQKGTAIMNSKRVICVSQNTKEDLLKFYPKFKEDNIKVIYNGVDNVYHPALIKHDSIIKHLIPFSSGEFVLYIGDRKSSYKNFNLAVNACKISNQPLVMVGGGMLSVKETQLLNNKLGVNNFKLLNGITNKQLNLIYNHAFCLLYPSLYEGFGIPILEAQRAGCPVISTNNSSIPEVAGKGAILLDDVSDYSIADALNLIKNDSTAVLNLKEKGLENSHRFSWDICYEQTKKVYTEVYQTYF